MEALFLLMIIGIIIYSFVSDVKNMWKEFKLNPDAFRKKYQSKRKPWRYSGYNGWHRCRRRNSFRAIMRKR